MTDKRNLEFQIAASETVNASQKNSDDELLRSFLAPARVDIADDGFTRRVMRRLPIRQNRLAKIWTAVCMLAFAVVFLLLHGWEMFQLAIVHILQNFSPEAFIHSISWTQIVYIVISFVILSAFGIYKVSEIE